MTRTQVPQEIARTRFEGLPAVGSSNLDVRTAPRYDFRMETSPATVVPSESVAPLYRPLCVSQ